MVDARLFARNPVLDTVAAAPEAEICVVEEVGQVACLETDPVKQGNEASDAGFEQEADQAEEVPDAGFVDRVIDSAEGYDAGP